MFQTLSLNLKKNILTRNAEYRHGINFKTKTYIFYFRLLETVFEISHAYAYIGCMYNELGIQ